MKIRAQVMMVLNLDRCIGCHTCSVTCKNVWSNREGVEYAWFNNVETKPGVGYPRLWEDQEKWKGGWQLDRHGKPVPRLGSRSGILSRIFANPHLPEMDNYYEPFTYDYSHLQSAPEGKDTPVARPCSLVTGEIMDKPKGSAAWEDDLGGPFATRRLDPNLRDVEAEVLSKFEETFMIYLPRLCEHCLNPGCVASCPSGSIYKRQEDGIVLVDQERCRGWRMCISGCPFKKTYYNWRSGKAEKCLFCYPRTEAGLPSMCAHSCVGRIRFMGVVLYDADAIGAVAATAAETGLYEAQLGLLLDPRRPDIQAQALADGVPPAWIDAAVRSPVYKMAVEWRIAFPLHPEFRTLPMVWYCPPLSPIQAAFEGGRIGSDGGIPDVRSLRVPIRYLANLLTAGAEAPVVSALERLCALRAFMRGRFVAGKDDPAIPARVGLDVPQIEEMYNLLAIANLADRFVIPTAQRELLEDAFVMRGDAGFSFDSGGLFASPILGGEKGTGVL